MQARPEYLSQLALNPWPLISIIGWKPCPAKARLSLGSKDGTGVESRYEASSCRSRWEQSGKARSRSSFFRLTAPCHSPVLKGLPDRSNACRVAELWTSILLHLAHRRNEGVWSASVLWGLDAGRPRTTGVSCQTPLMRCMFFDITSLS